MAIMIPGPDAMEDYNGSFGEKQLFDLLSELPKDYYIFHSARWNERFRREKSKKKYVEWREADFIVFYPPRGLIFIEVKDGTISFTKERGWTQTNRVFGTTKVIDPMYQAQRSMFYIQDMIQNKFGQNYPYSYAICSAVWFTSADKSCISGDLPNLYKQELLMWANDMASKESVQQAFNRIYDYSEVKVDNPSETMTKDIVDLISPEFGVMASIYTTRAAKKAMFLKMTQEQAIILDYLDEQDEAAIHGHAGTGKTCLALHKARDLARKESVLFLCYNRFLRDDLNKNNEYSNLTICNLDSLYYQKTGTRIDFDDMSESVHNDILTYFLLDAEENGITYKNIIIDEAQDFCNDHLTLLRDIARSHKGVFYVFFDKNQHVHGKEFPQILNELECRLVLNRNCRNTKEIAITSTRPVGIAEEKIKTKYDNENIAAIKPRLFMPENKEAMLTLLDKLISAYVDNKVPKERIVVLTVNGQGSTLITKDDYVLSSRNKLSAVPEPGKVWFTTARRFKGLEAEAIICIDIDGENFTSDDEKNALYVGASRAQTFLDLIAVVPDQTSLFSLAEAVCGTKPTSRLKANSNLAKSLQVRISTDPELVMLS